MTSLTVIGFTVCWKLEIYFQHFGGVGTECELCYELCCVKNFARSSLFGARTVRASYGSYGRTGRCVKCFLRTTR